MGFSARGKGRTIAISVGTVAVLRMMRGLRRRWLSIARSLVVVLIAAGCTGCCCGSSKTVAKVEQPIRVDWVVSKGWDRASGGRGAILPYWWAVHSTLTVHASPEYSFSATCSEPSPELLVSPDGNRLAYRCESSSDWTLEYLGTNKRHFPDCTAKLGAGKLDWSKIPQLRDRALDLLPCLNLCWWARPGYDEYEDNVFAELAPRLTPAEMAQLLLVAAELRCCRDTHWDLGEPDVWDDTMARLPAPEREKVVEEMAVRLSKVEADPPPLYLLWRYSRWTRKAHESVAPRMLSWLVPIWKGDKEVEGKQRRHLVDYMLMRLAPVLSQDAAQVACRLLDESQEDRKPLYLAIANGHKACPSVVQERLARNNSIAFCRAPGDRQVLCPEKEVASIVHERLEQQRIPFEKPKQEEEESLDLHKVMLAAIYAQGPLPAWLTRLEKRTTYKIDQPSSPRCCDSAEERCFCVSPEELPSTLPRAEDKSEVDVVSNCCSLVIEDAKGRLKVKNTSYTRKTALEKESTETTGPD